MLDVTHSQDDVETDFGVVLLVSVTVATSPVVLGSLCDSS